MSKIKSLTLKGFKTIKNVESLEFENINIFIGANGSGKSNIISFFEMISYMMTNAFGKYVAENGFASSMLYHGQKVTREIDAKVAFNSNKSQSDYEFRISHTVDDRFLFMGETIVYKNHNNKKPKKEIISEAGYKETKLRDVSSTNRTAKNIKNLLASIRVFHFHDTSKTAYIHQARPVESNSALMSDGGNLGPFLYNLSKKDIRYYERIVSYIQQVAPFFDDFILEPHGSSIQLKFKEQNSELELGSFRLSDGTIRFICLATLLLQPKSSLPKIIFIDEPELGLHPVAIDILTEMINVASQNAQIFITAQSPRLVDQFQPENIVVIDRKQDMNGRYFSDFKKLNSNALYNWVDEYKISDLWESNIIGGRP